MDGLIGAVGDGLTSLIAGTFGVIGAALRSIVSSANQLLPGGLLWVVVFIVLVLSAWTLAKR